MELLGLRLIQGEPPPSQTPPPSFVHEAAAHYGLSREVPLPSPEQLERALDAARRLGDNETVKALQDMQLQILDTIEDLTPIAEAFTNHVQALQQLERESQHRPKNAINS